MNYIDLAAVALILISIVLGWRAGLVSQAFSFLGAGLGIAALVLVAPAAAARLANFDPLTRSAIVVVAFFVAIGIGQAVGGWIARALRPRDPGPLRSLDALGGALFGLVEGVVLVWLIGGILVAAPFPRVALEARTSAVLHEVNARLPSPVSVIEEVARALDVTGLPQVFVGITPAPPAPAAEPGQGQADAIAAGARDSTARVEADACLRLQSGTAFSVRPGVFLTNAHVVAGAGDVELSLDGRLDRYRAEVVLFDPELDIAVLRAPDLELPPLTLASSAPARGEPAAALGFTGGARLRTVPAVVNRTLAAIGRDIYGRATVSREVIELRAQVAPGDSGGPLVLPDGTVGGVIFSESRQDRSVGYALSPDAVSTTARPALGATVPVDTGSCTD